MCSITAVSFCHVLCACAACNVSVINLGQPEQGAADAGAAATSSLLHPDSCVLGYLAFMSRMKVLVLSWRVNNAGMHVLSAMNVKAVGCACFRDATEIHCCRRGSAVFLQWFLWSLTSAGTAIRLASVRYKGNVGSEGWCEKQEMHFFISVKNDAL